MTAIRAFFFYHFNLVGLTNFNSTYTPKLDVPHYSFIVEDGPIFCDQNALQYLTGDVNIPC